MQLNKLFCPGCVDWSTEFETMMHKLPVTQDSKTNRKKTAAHSVQPIVLASPQATTTMEQQIAIGTATEAAANQPDLSPKSKKRQAETRAAENASLGGGVVALLVAPKPVNSAPYKRYVMQFAHDAPEVPENVWSVLSASLATIHLLSPLRCKPVTVEKILKDNNLTSWIPHSTRISIMYCGTPLPVFSSDLIVSLIQRYEELHKAAVQLHGHTKSLPSKETLTYCFLSMENKYALASAFTTRKTSPTSQIHTTKFWDLIAICKRNAPHMHV